MLSENGQLSCHLQKCIFMDANSEASIHTCIKGMNVDSAGVHASYKRLCYYHKWSFYQCHPLPTPHSTPNHKNNKHTFTNSLSFCVMYNYVHCFCKCIWKCICMCICMCILCGDVYLFACSVVYFPHIYPTVCAVCKVKKLPPMTPPLSNHESHRMSTR